MHATIKTEVVKVRGQGMVAMLEDREDRGYSLIKIEM